MCIMFDHQARSIYCLLMAQYLHYNNNEANDKDGGSIMLIGIPKEIKNNESRVAITPAGVHAFTLNGHQVVVEKSAGEGSGISDQEYINEGAQILDTAEEGWKADWLAGGVLPPGPRAPQLVTEDMVKAMTPRSVIVHIAIDQGGIIATI